MSDHTRRKPRRQGLSGAVKRLPDERPLFEDLGLKPGTEVAHPRMFPDYEPPARKRRRKSRPAIQLKLPDK